MHDDQVAGWCRDCGAPVLLQQRGVHHTLHAVLSLVTLGCWLPVYLWQLLARPPWRCDQCGGRAVLVGVHDDPTYTAWAAGGRALAWWERLPWGAGLVFGTGTALLVVIALAVPHL